MRPLARNRFAKHAVFRRADEQLAIPPPVLCAVLLQLADVVGGLLDLIRRQMRRFEYPPARHIFVWTAEPSG